MTTSPTCPECDAALLPSPELEGHVYVCPEHILPPDEAFTNAKVYSDRLRELQAKHRAATISTRPRKP